MSSGPLSAKEKALGVRLQWGLPLKERPYGAIGAELGMAEADVLQGIAALRSSGVVRFFGGFFSSGALGCVSALCALRVPPEALDRVASAVESLPEATHHYLRDDDWNAWFTLGAPTKNRLDALVRHVERVSGVGNALVLFSRRVVKLRADFRFLDDQGSLAMRRPGGCSVRDPGVGSPAVGIFVPLEERDRRLLLLLDQGFPEVPEPFSVLGDAFGLGAVAVLRRLRALKARGILRRIGLSLHHGRTGHGANALAVWRAPEDRWEHYAQVLEAFPSVSHAYFRTPVSEWPYSFYGMVHAAGRDEIRDMLRDVEARSGLPPARLLFSLRELKKKRCPLEVLLRTASDEGR